MTARGTEDIEATAVVFTSPFSSPVPICIYTLLLAYAHVYLGECVLCMPTVLLKALVPQTVEVSLDQLYADAKPDFNVQTMQNVPVIPSAMVKKETEPEEISIELYS